MIITAKAITFFKLLAYSNYRPIDPLHIYNIEISNLYFLSPAVYSDRIPSLTVASALNYTIQDGVLPFSHTVKLTIIPKITVGNHHSFSLNVDLKSSCKQVTHRFAIECYSCLIYAY
jgi:hypothetical protein